MSLPVLLRTFRENYKQIFENYSPLPSRPRKEICMKYMRSGECANGRSCRYDHPVERFGFEETESSTTTLINLLGNLCALCSSVSPEAMPLLTTFIGDIVAVLDKYYDELTAEYGPGCILYGDSVLKLHAVFRKNATPQVNKRNDRQSNSKGRKFEEKYKILLECLQYLNTRWSDEENLFSSVVNCSLSFPVNDQLLPSLQHELDTLADTARIQQGINNERKALIQTALLGIANSVVNSHIEDTVQSEGLLNSCVLKPFGSSANHLGLSSSDLDMCLGYSEALKVDPGVVLEGMAEHLRSEGNKGAISLEVKEVVLGTRVPVLKLFDSLSNLEVDICVNNFLALQNTALLRSYALLQPRFRALVLAVKHWAKRRGCGDPRNATLTSYAWTLLVAHFLINHDEGLLPPALEVEIDGNKNAEVMSPVVAAAAADTVDSKSSVTQLFMGFFAYYGACCTGVNGFSPFHHVLSIRERALSTGKRLQKSTSLYSKLLTLADTPSSTLLPFSVVHQAGVVVNSAEVSDVVPLLGGLSLDGEAKIVPSPPMTLSGTALPPTPPTPPTASSSSSTVLSSPAPTWRFCIEDPYEEHDLGRVVYSQTGQGHIMSEIRRVLTLFQQFNTTDAKAISPPGGQFWSVLCEVNQAVPLAAKMCMTCGQPGHFSRDCHIALTCHICRQTGHFAKDCTNLKCRKCLQFGHFARDCSVPASKATRNNRYNQRDKKVYVPGASKRAVNQPPPQRGGAGPSQRGVEKTNAAQSDGMRSVPLSNPPTSSGRHNKIPHNSNNQGQVRKFGTHHKKSDGSKAGADSASPDQKHASAGFSADAGNKHPSTSNSTKSKAKPNKKGRIVEVIGGGGAR